MCALFLKRQLAADVYRYFREVEELDPDKIWYDLCEDVDVSAPIRSFFKFYITNSEAERLVLGPEERVMKRCMESTKSVLGIWKTLRGAAEMNLLREKRRLERDRAHIYYVNGIPGLREDGPVVAIKNVNDSPTDLRFRAALTSCSGFEAR